MISLKELQNCPANLDLITGFESSRLDLRSINKSTIRTVAILEHKLFAIAFDGGMSARDLGVEQPHRIMQTATDRDRNIPEFKTGSLIRPLNDQK